MFRKRGSGVLLHVTSLPSRYGIGDLGPEAYRFADFLSKAKQGYWQILPLKPTAAETGHSPYSSLSAFAGNTLVISPEMLHQDDLLTRTELRDPPSFPSDHVDFESVSHYKQKLLNLAYERFKETRKRDSYDIFCSTHQSWLEDYVLFQVIRQHFNRRSWSDWPAKLRDRDPDALHDVKVHMRDAIDRETFLQYEFFRQWCSLKNYCNDSGIQIIGDIAIYVGYDSTDVWAHRDIFKLTRRGKPKYVAGFPPDAFSSKGQLWGTPLYDWDMLRKTGYHWWIERIEHGLSMYDVLRIDHFRGFIQYWQVPASHKTAERGKWVEGPKDDFVNTLVRRFAFPSLIVEVLGYITPEITEFLEKYDLPDMNVLIFAFEKDFASGPYYPHNIKRNSVIYTDTHDTPTIRGWFEDHAKPKEKQRLFRYLGRRVPASKLPWEVIRLAMMARSDLAVIPMQDLLGLGKEGRMNVPGVAKGQWRWRFDWGQLESGVAGKLAEMTETYGRA